MQREMAASRMVARLHYSVFWLRFLSTPTAKRISGVAFFPPAFIILPAGYYMYSYFSFADRRRRCCCCCCCTRFVRSRRARQKLCINKMTFLSSSFGVSLVVDRTENEKRRDDARPSVFFSATKTPSFLLGNQRTIESAGPP